MQRIAVGRERHVDRNVLQRLVEGRAVERAGALVEQAGEQRADAGLVRRVLRGATVEGEVHRDQGDRVILDEPRLDSAGRAHLLHARGAARLGGRGDERLGASGHDALSWVGFKPGQAASAGSAGSR